MMFPEPKKVEKKNNLSRGEDWGERNEECRKGGLVKMTYEKAMWKYATMGT